MCFNKVCFLLPLPPLGRQGRDWRINYFVKPRTINLDDSGYKRGKSLAREKAFPYSLCYAFLSMKHSSNTRNFIGSMMSIGLLTTKSKWGLISTASPT
jgi:hypothetical protein